MRHQLKIYTKDGKYYPWFRNSMQSLARQPGVLQYDLYEKSYNVKIIYMPTKRVKDLKFAGKVEFPSKKDATMFILRWS